MLRHVLARYCGDDPGAMAFACGGNAKPVITRAGGLREPITFNLAHSHERALLTVANDCAIGVDLEKNRDDFDPLLTARQFFFRDEQTAILAAPAEFRRDAFFRHWVAKESVLKAEGVGLSFPFDSFCVTFGSEPTGARVQSRDPAGLASQWFFLSIATRHTQSARGAAAKFQGTRQNNAQRFRVPIMLDCSTSNQSWRRP